MMTSILISNTFNMGMYFNKITRWFDSWFKEATGPVQIIRKITKSSKNIYTTKLIGSFFHVGVALPVNWICQLLELHRSQNFICLFPLHKLRYRPFHFLPCSSPLLLTLVSASLDLWTLLPIIFWLGPWFIHHFVVNHRVKNNFFDVRGLLNDRSHNFMSAQGNLWDVARIHPGSFSLESVERARMWRCNLLLCWGQRVNTVRLGKSHLVHCLKTILSFL